MNPPRTIPGVALSDLSDVAGGCLAGLLGPNPAAPLDVRSRRPDPVASGGSRVAPLAPPSFYLVNQPPPLAPIPVGH